MDGWGANRALDEGRALKQQYQLHELVLKHVWNGLFFVGVVLLYYSYVDCLVGEGRECGGGGATAGYFGDVDVNRAKKRNKRASICDDHHRSKERVVTTHPAD